MTNTFINHCISMYDALNDNATDKELDDGRVVRIFAGRYTAVYKSTNIAQTYYSPIRKCLERHNAIRILQKGSREADTVIQLLGLPETWDVDGWNDSVDLTNRVTDARLATAVEEMQKSLGGMNIVNALQEIESRLVALAQDIDNISFRLDGLENAQTTQTSQ